MAGGTTLRYVPVHILRLLRNWSRTRQSVSGERASVHRGDRFGGDRRRSKGMARYRDWFDKGTRLVPRWKLIAEPAHLLSYFIYYIRTFVCSETQWYRDLSRRPLMCRAKFYRVTALIKGAGSRINFHKVYLSVRAWVHAHACVCVQKKNWHFDKSGCLGVVKGTFLFLACRVVQFRTFANVLFARYTHAKGNESCKLELKMRWQQESVYAIS